VLVTVVVAVLCGWGTTTAVVELRKPQPEVLQARAELEDEIRRRSEAVQARERANLALREQIVQAQSRALTSDGGSDLAERARSLAVVSGESPATGPGIEITLDDAPREAEPEVGVDPRENPQTDEGRVLDRDLQFVVNGLWASGAEAVAIDGHRLTALSAIRSAGLAILVDYRPLVPPYVVEVVGDPAQLQTRFAASMAGPYLQSLRDNYGVRASIAVKEQLRLPGASGITLRSATVPRPPTREPTRLRTTGTPQQGGETAPSGPRAAAPSQEVSP
jgi:uncharacterized protein YlxW (UPF0749 family)